jgi:Na+/H+ antiporter NhaA
MIGQNSASLEFSLTIDDTDINGIDLITWNNDGLITEFKVFIRPLQGVNLIHKMMQGMLESFKNVS